MRRYLDRVLESYRGTRHQILTGCQPASGRTLGDGNVLRPPAAEGGRGDATATNKRFTISTFRTTSGAWRGDYEEISLGRCGRYRRAFCARAPLLMSLRV